MLAWHMNMAFIKGGTPKINWNFPFDAHLGQGILFCKLEIGPQCIIWLSRELLPKFWVSLMNFISSPSPSKLKGQIETFLEFYPLTEVFDLYPQNLPNLSGAHVWSRPVAKTSRNLDMLAEIYGLQIRKVTCGDNCTWYTLGSSWDYLPKHVVPNPQKNPTCLEYGFYICYFGPHDSGQHPKPIHTLPSM